VFRLNRIRVDAFSGIAEECTTCRSRDRWRHTETGRTSYATTDPTSATVDPGFGQQELPQDDELLPHEDELLPHDDELLPQDEELPLEQPLEEPSLVPASHQDEWSTGLPASCAVVALCVPALVGHPPRPGPALEPRAVAGTPRSSQARRHARRTIKVTTATNASTNPLINTNAINTTPPVPPGCARIARSMPGGAVT
jgi:hypothetical protein